MKALFEYSLHLSRVIVIGSAITILPVAIAAAAVEAAEAAYAAVTAAPSETEERGRV